MKKWRISKRMKVALTVLAAVAGVIGSYMFFSIRRPTLGEAKQMISQDVHPGSPYLAVAAYLASRDIDFRNLNSEGAAAAVSRSEDVPCPAYIEGKLPGLNDLGVVIEATYKQPHGFNEPLVHFYFNKFGILVAVDPNLGSGDYMCFNSAPFRGFRREMPNIYLIGVEPKAAT